MRFFHRETQKNKPRKGVRFNVADKKPEKKKYPEKISLGGDRKLINAVKKSGMKTVNPQGPYNGYGYEKLPLHVVIETVGDKRKFNALKKEMDGAPKKPKLSDEQKVDAWASRLSKLTGIPKDDALDIANEKLSYKDDKINEMIDRQNDRYSPKRATLMRKMERENPLRRIEDKDHALAILAASDRHKNTSYEYELQRAKDMAMFGEIDRSEVKDVARSNIRRRSSE